mgnify:CR=1 FL=1
MSVVNASIVTCVTPQLAGMCRDSFKVEERMIDDATESDAKAH